MDYGELLSFIFLKVEQYTPSFRESLERVFHDTRLPGYCFYDVFGASDVILRVWSRSDSRHALLRHLDQMIGVSIRSIFVCSDTPRYLWWHGFQKAIESRLVFAYSPDDLRAVQFGEGRPELKDELRSRGFLHDSPRNNGPSFVKFFVRVEVAGGADKEAWLERLTAILKQSPIVDDISIYFSSSQAILIKATTEHFHSIGDFVIEVVRSTLAKCTTETFLVAAPARHESDEVDFDGAFLDPPLIRICEMWSIERKKVLLLTQPVRQKLSKVFAEVASTNVLSLDARGIVRACFVSIVDADPSAMEEKLVFLRNLEGLLFTKCVPIIMKELFGTNWMKEKLTELSERTNINHRYDPNQWDMGDSVNLLGGANAVTSGKIDQILGSNWELGLRKALSLRNDFFHAKSDTLAKWDTIVGQLLIALPVYYRIVQFSSDQN